MTKNEKSKINALIIGLGQIGAGYDIDVGDPNFVYTHAKALYNSSHFNLVGGVDTSPINRKRFTKKYDLPSYDNVRQVDDSSDIGLVVVSTSTESHIVDIREILKLINPKIILCEKPLSYNICESREIVTACANSGILLLVNYMRRSEPGAIEVKRRIISGEIEHPVKGIVWYSKGLIHSGSHFVNLLEYWFGPVHDYNIISKGNDLDNGDAEPDFLLKFNSAEFIFLAVDESNFSHHSLEFIAKNGRLRYENGGKIITWNGIANDETINDKKFLTPDIQLIDSKFVSYQRHVLEEISKFIHGIDHSLCHGESALRSLEIINDILDSRR